MFIDDNTPREQLEECAIVEIGWKPEKVDAMSTEELREAIRDWITEGDECGGC
jgi:hypothetical protein